MRHKGAHEPRDTLGMPGGGASDPEIDVVYVGTYNHLHYANCCLALQAGQPIFTSAMGSEVSL
jgi:hypothetical protein